MAVWHLTFAADGRNPLFLDEGCRLTAVRRLAAVAGPRVVLFCLVDEHVHVVLTGERVEVGRMARSVLLALRPWAAVSIDPARIRLVAGRAHLRRLVRYVLDQPRHHDLPGHPALWSGSCFVDLVGARVVPNLDLRIREVLPRFRLREAHEAVGLPPTRLVPLQGTTVRRLGAFRLSQAAAASLCVEHPLRGKTAPVTLARAAMCQIAREAGIATTEVTDVLGIQPPAREALASASARSVFRPRPAQRLPGRCQVPILCQLLNNRTSTGWAETAVRAGPTIGL